ncbi:AraC family transcriptional regulator [Cupriavidus oxalaticus]|uniref:AraC family transcriptional regulator n=1 Tax=Cupriavidus oxalaticus TaxID=96344 RepID=A0A5P3V9B1_9BURK|nr:AraC family transcriptional regulator [Cupriavidus oxalaticus]QEZ42956.1 AraC family transcriptional regulator [Cupriavidus oxalaticus]
MPYLLRSASLANYVEVARSVGLNPYQQLSDVGLGRHVLLNTEIRIPVEAVSGLLEASARVSGHTDFGLRMAESRQLSDLGPLAIALLEEPTLRKAVDALARYLRLHNEALAIRIEESDNLLMIRTGLISGFPGMLRQSIELVVGVIYRTLHCFLGRMAGASLTPFQVCFTHAAPANAATHTRLFGMPVSFGQEFDGIVYRISDLEVPLKSHDPAMAQQVRQYLDTMLAKTNNSMADNVRRLVSTLLSQGDCSIDRVAQELSIDRRTIHRKLKRSGESYSMIVNAVRIELATRYIDNCERRLSEVAALLGFSSLSTFSRWFSRQFGCSVSEWRARQARATRGRTGFALGGREAFPVRRAAMSASHYAESV